MIRVVTRNEAVRDYKNLRKYKTDRMRAKVTTGNKATDYGTFEDRMRVRRRGHPSCLEYISTKEGADKVQEAANMYGTEMWHQYQLYGGMVNGTKPYVAKYLCKEFGATSVLDPTCGYGGRMLGVTSLDCDYIGIDSNFHMQEGYDKMMDIVSKHSKAKVQLFFQPTEDVDYSKFDYDVVLTSPPWELAEVYEEQPTYNDWHNDFFLPTFTRAFTHLKAGGWMVLFLTPKLASLLAIHLKKEGLHPHKACDRKVELLVTSRRQPFVDKEGKARRSPKTDYVYCWQKPVEVKFK